MIRPFLIRIFMSFLVVLFFTLHTIGVYNAPIIERIENFLYDTRLKITMPNTRDERIVIVDIDEKSLAAEGRWPWSRDRLAQMVDILFDTYHINILGFDMVFSEKDESSCLRLLDGFAHDPLKDDLKFKAHLEKIRPSLENDAIFAKSLKDRSVVLGYYFRMAMDRQPELTTGMLPPASLSLDEPILKEIPLVTPSGYTSNLPQIQNNARAAGFFGHPLFDLDGVFRKIPIVQEYEGNVYEALSLSMFRTLLESPPLDLDVTAEKGEDVTMALEGLKIGGLEIPVDEQGNVLIPYRGHQGSFPYVSAVDVLTQTADPDVLKDAIVIVGTTTTGLKDLYTTPVQSIFPGVEIHANLISGFLDQTIKHKPGYTLGIEFVMLVAIGLFMSLSLPRMSPLWALVVTLTTLTASIVFNFYMWTHGGLFVPLVSSIFLILTLFIVHMSSGYFIEASSKRKIAHLFEQYVPPELVDEMSKNPSDYGMSGESREMTVFFADIRSYTATAENADPRQMRLLINTVFDYITELIYKHRGTIDKYMGDAVMAFWGAPLEDPDHAQHAVNTALEIVGDAPRLRQTIEKKGLPVVDFGISLNTGLMNVGNMGSKYRMAYTVLGDAVNLGFRLEDLNKKYDVSIILSEFTKNQITGVVLLELDRVRVTGKLKSVTVFSPVGIEGNIDPAVQEELRIYHCALEDFRNQKWHEAASAFNELLKRSPGKKLYMIYLDRISELKENPPGKEWDAVFSFK